jgi:hypothetical protein
MIFTLTCQKCESTVIVDYDEFYKTKSFICKYCSNEKDDFDYIIEYMTQEQKLKHFNEILTNMKTRRRLGLV